MSTAELAIRARRAAFNRAIAEGDAAAIGPMLARDCVMVTGTDSAVIAGRVAQVKIWARDFAAPGRLVPGRLVYVRLPSEIIVSPVEPIAFERGEWHGSEAPGDAPAASGLYTAKWREVGSQWVIEAEVFVTLA